jgi:DNA-binding NarL/FixJ family response regulator
LGVAAFTIRAVRAVGSGNSYLDPAVTARVLTAHRSASSLATRTAVLTALTPPRTRLLALIAKGRTNTEIADELVISGLTVTTHIGRVFTKLGVCDRAAAILFAYEHRIVTPG